MARILVDQGKKGVVVVVVQRELIAGKERGVLLLLMELNWSLHLFILEVVVVLVVMVWWK